MKILYIVPDLVVGGVTTIVENISKNMRGRGHETYILTLKPNNAKNEGLLTLKMLRNSDVFLAIYRLRRIILELKPDIIHSHTIYPNLLALLYKALFNSKIKIINTEHNTIEFRQSKLPIFLVYKKLSGLADKTSFVSKASMDSYLENFIIKKNKSYLIYNGVEYDKKYSVDDLGINSSDENIKFCFIGRIAEEKNLKLMIEAFNKLYLKYGNVGLYLIGDGILQEDLKNIIRKKNINNIFFLGYKSQVGGYIDKMDCILLSSLTESLPTVILEAYARKKIVISTNVGGVSEIVKNDKFLSKSDDVKKYFECLEYFYNLDSNQRDAFEAENYDIFLNNFTMNEMVVNYENLYFHVLN